MVEAGWTPTVNNYLGRVTKARILQAVREAKGPQAAELIGHLKKTDMAREAERLMTGSSWLPEPLRTTVVDGISERGAVEDEAAEPDQGETVEVQDLPASLLDASETSRDQSGETGRGVDGERFAAAE
jgi:ParB family chromosome partitioning protein